MNLSRVAMRLYMQRRRARFRRMLLCPSCGRWRLNTAWVLCGRCRLRNYGRVQIWHMRHDS